MLTDSPELPSDTHPNLKLLSHSSDVLLDKCPRKYELYKLSPDVRNNEARALRAHEELMILDQSDNHLSFGSVVGIGTQEYLSTGDKNKSIISMMTAWEGNLEDERGSADRKSFWNALGALDSFVGFRHTYLGNYALAIFDGKPAIELGFLIDCGNGYTYRGFLDALLIDKNRGHLIPYEGKTTKFRNVHEAVYKNSGQGLGYSLVLDAIAKILGTELSSSFDVIYNVWKSSVAEWEPFRFRKNHTQRAQWIRNIILKQQSVELFSSLGHFPMHGWNCYDFFRPCHWFGICEMDNSTIFPKGISAVPEKKDDLSKYQFKFNLEELVEAQLLKQEQVL